jgi:predicted ATPase
MLFLDPVPARMRDYAFPTDSALLGDGKNLSAVLYHLWGKDPDTIQDFFDPKLYEYNRTAILNFIQSLPEQDIEGLEFIVEPRGGVLVTLIESFGRRSRKVDASLLSDGTLRVLSIAAAMLSASEGSLVIIEEIDNGVHPSRARHLLKNIHGLAQKRNLRVLLSTHNPAMLDGLPDAALPDVLLCYRDPSEGHSQVLRLQDAPDYPELIAQDSLGKLMTSGALERFVKQPRDPDRQDRALAWLQALRDGNPK